MGLISGVPCPWIFCVSAVEEEWLGCCVMAPCIIWIGVVRRYLFETRLRMDRIQMRVLVG